MVVKKILTVFFILSTFYAFCQIPIQNTGLLYDLKLPLAGKLIPGSSENIRNTSWGVCGHWIADEHILTVDQKLDMLNAIGAKWVFLCPDWNEIEHEKSIYNWNALKHPFDDVVQGLVKRKINIAIQIYGGNSLYMSNGSDPNGRQLASVENFIDDRYVQSAWLAYVKALVSRYKDYVTTWEIWNEPNGPYFWKTEPKAEEYGKIVKIATSAIRSVQKNATILAGSTALPDYDFLSDFLKSEGANSFDFWSMHPYGALPESSDSAIIRLKNLLSVHSKSTKIWQSECGFPSDSNTAGWGYGGAWDETKQAKWLLRRLLCDASLDMPVSIYFVLYDYPAKLEGGPQKGQVGINKKGLYSYDTWQPKLSAYVFSYLSGFVNDRFSFIPVDSQTDFIISPAQSQQIDKKNLRTAIAAQKETGELLYFYWLGLPMEKKFNAKKTNAIVSGKISNPVLVNLMDGCIYKLKKQKRKDGNILLKDIPITDFPLVICDKELLKSDLKNQSGNALLKTK